MSFDLLLLSYHPISSSLCHIHLYLFLLCIFFFNDPAPTKIYTLSLHDALPISSRPPMKRTRGSTRRKSSAAWSDSCFWVRSEEHTSELQSLTNLVCRLLLEKKKKKKILKIETNRKTSDKLIHHNLNYNMIASIL